MKKDRGEVMVGVLVGLLIGATMLYIQSGKKAQQKANATGMSVSQWEVIQEDAGKSTLTVIAPAVAGAGVGWLLEQASDSGNEASRNNSVSVNGNDGTVNISIVGDSESQTSTENRTDADNSYNNE